MTEKFNKLDEILDFVAEDVISHKQEARLEIQTKEVEKNILPEGGAYYDFYYNACIMSDKKEYGNLKLKNERILIERNERLQERLNEEYDYIIGYLKEKGVSANIKDSVLVINYKKEDIKKMSPGGQLSLFPDKK